MHYYIALTSKCNLMCKYCHGKSVDDFMSFDEMKDYDLDLPCSTNVKIDDLKRLSKEDNNFVLTFYGGEPLLKINFIRDIMDNVKAKKFMIQTNGIFLDKLGRDYVNRLSIILASIDGTQSHTNERRGKGVYEKVVSNLNLIRKEGFKGEVVARMTVDETCDIFQNVTFLIENPDFEFGSVHWQIDAMFWSSDYMKRDFKDWSLNVYNPGIEKLVNWWVDKMKTESKVLRIYPFLGIVYSLLTGEKSGMRCGAGHSVLGIQTNGNIVACPITAGYKPFFMGDVKSSSLKEIEKNKILPQKQCLSCEIKDICGGRCLYGNYTQFWGDKGFSEVCQTVFFLVNCLKRKLPEIEKLIKNKIISVKDFEYEKYNGCEIIP